MDRLSPINLDHVMYLDQVTIYQDLLPLVNQFAINTEDIGKVDGFEFKIKLKSNTVF